MDSRAQKILARLSRTPEYRAAEAQESEGHVKGRKVDLDRSAAIKAELAVALIEPQKAVKKALNALEKAQQGVVTADTTLRLAQVEVHNQVARAERETNQIEQRLNEGAIPGIAPFLGDLAGLWDHERKGWLFSHRDQPGSAGERIAQIRRVTEQVTELYFETNPEEAETALAKLKADLDAPMAAVA